LNGRGFLEEAWPSIHLQNVNVRTHVCILLNKSVPGVCVQERFLSNILWAPVQCLYSLKFSKSDTRSYIPSVPKRINAVSAADLFKVCMIKQSSIVKIASMAAA
jgi:hypothetical protein